MIFDVSAIAPFAMLITGLGLLAWSGDRFVDLAEQLAARLGVSRFIIGLTVMAFGTSAPELFVSVDAVREGVSELAIGNIVGSNIANILMVLGIVGLFAPISCSDRALQAQYAFLVLATGGFCFAAGDGSISRLDGVFLLGGLIGFLALCFFQGQLESGLDASDAICGFNLGQAIMLALTLVGILVGAELTVHSGTDVALQMGVGPEVVGLTVIAIGTSLPELVAAMSAVLKGRSDLGFGTVIGSNVFNLLAVGGVSSQFATGISSIDAINDLLIMIASALILLPFIVLRRPFSKFPAAGAVLGFAVFIGLTYA